MPISTGTRFDRYEILAPLGAGGMGEVYLARDTRLERKIALKLLPEEFTRDPNRLYRFEQEAKTASALNHPNIITIHEIGECESRHFITTEYVDGRTLRQIINGGMLAQLSAIDIAIQVSGAIAAAHDAGIIHRDIKPENIMLRQDGIVKVLDFGLAKLTERFTQTSDPDAPTLSKLDTDPGTVMGTATYMSPEQARGLKVDARTDVFSLGVVIYEMLASRPPFGGQTPTDIMMEVLNREPLPLATYVPATTAELQRIVSKALRKDREERYQTIKDLLLDLKSLKRELEGSTTMALPSNPSLDSGGKSISYETVVITSGEPFANAPTDKLIERKTSSAEYIVSRINYHRRGVILALVLLAMALTALYFFDWRRNEIDSIAVIPFVNLNTDENARLLSDVITDSIINNLSQLSNLNVKPRTAALQFTGREVDAKEVAKALDVRSVLTGRVIQRGDDLSVNVYLIDARDNRHLWGQQFDHKVSDMMLIQQEVTNAVTDVLRLKLSGDERRRMESYQLCLKGRNAWNKRTADSMKESIKYFEQAKQLDPKYAPAYAGLADCYNMLMAYGVMPMKETLPKAREAAEKALELDDTLGEAHAARAYIYYQWEWNWSEAESEFRRAIYLNPNYATAHQWFSNMLAATGRMDEATAAAKRAGELEQMSLIVTLHYSWISYLARQYDKSLAHTQKMLKIDPNFFSTHRYLGLAYEGEGRYGEAIDSFQKALSLSRGSSLLKSELAHAYASAGKRKEAEQLLSELQETSKIQYISSYYFALAYVGLNEKERAIEALIKARDEHAERLVYLNSDPRFDTLRTDPRYIELLRSIGFAL